MAKLTSAILLVLLLTALALSDDGGDSPLPSHAASAAPEYDETGALKRPTGFREWIFVGTSLGLGYGKVSEAKPAEEPTGEFHNVYIQLASYAEYLRTGTFPDGTMLVSDVYAGEKRDEKGVVARGVYSGEHHGLEVAVKNSKRPDGSKTDWAYYIFGAADKLTATAKPDAACYNCHREHASVDNVWVQFYPVLRDGRPANKPTE